jgi:hypothetical protein
MKQVRRAEKLLVCFVRAADGFATSMDRELRLDLKWHDADVVEVRVAAWNGAFGGTADAYVGIGCLREAAAELEGFPRTPADARVVTFGASGPNWAGGAASLRFYCADQAGHAYVEVRLESGDRVANVTQSSLLCIPIEPAALDSFVADLRRLEDEKQGTARLRAR